MLSFCKFTTSDYGCGQDLGAKVLSCAPLVAQVQSPEEVRVQVISAFDTCDGAFTMSHLIEPDPFVMLAVILQLEVEAVRPIAAALDTFSPSLIFCSAAVLPAEISDRPAVNLDFA